MKNKGALTENHIKTYVSLSRMFENYQIATKSIFKFSDFNNKAFYWNFFRVVDAIYRNERLSLEDPPAEKEIYLNEEEIKLAIENRTNNEEFKIARQYLIMASFMGFE